MARQCEICDKKTITGGHRLHKKGSSGAGGAWAHKAPRTLRKWLPNLRQIKVEVNGTPMHAKVCMKCYKRLRNDSLMASAA